MWVVIRCEKFESYQVEHVLCRDVMRLILDAYTKSKASIPLHPQVKESTLLKITLAFDFWLKKRSLKPAVRER